MDDIISRQAAIDAVEETTWYHQNRNNEMVSGANSELHQAWYKADDIYAALNNVPTAKPSATLMKVEVGVDKESLRKAMEEAELTLLPAEKKGKWIKDRLSSTCGGSYGVYRCSECENSYQDIGYGWNYCPNCGARMEV